MDLGDPIREVEIVPEKEPVPSREPATVPDDDRESEPEEIPA
jgi:hypothetical protein